MKTYYVIRSGWNAANQPATRSTRNPKNCFESNRYCLLGVVEAGTVDEAIDRFSGDCYNNQMVFAVTNPRKIKGLTAAIRSL